MSDVEATATDIALIARGHLVAHRSPEALLREVAGEAWEWVVPSAALPEIKQRHRVTSTMRRGDGVQVRIVADTSPGPDARPASPTLEDAYLHLISGPRAETAPA